MITLATVVLLSVARFQTAAPVGELGPAVGQPLPLFEALDQEGRPRDFASLRGPRGLLLLLFRSADW